MRSSQRKPLKGLALLTTIVSMTSLTACGSNTADDNGGVATIGSTAAPAASSPADTTEDNSTLDTATPVDGSELEAPSDINEAAVLFDNCMAEHDFPTDMAGSLTEGPVAVEQHASSGGDDGAPVAIGPGGIEIAAEDMDAFDAANEACRGHLANAQPDDELSPEQQAAMEDAVLHVEQCMQDKGFPVNFSVGGGSDAGGVSVNEETDGGDDPGAGQALPPTDDERAAMDDAIRECNQIFDEYPELADVPLPGAP